MPKLRVLILSWEYPPIVEGGLARHVRKLSEQLVRAGVEVHVVTRGDRHCPSDEQRHGVFVHRVREPDYPKANLEAFIRWVDRMNEDMRVLASQICDALDIDLVHSHDWLVAAAAEQIARQLGQPWLVTVHATEYGRHQGWVNKYPQSYIHAIERRMVQRADHVITCSHYMREHVADVFSTEEQRIVVIPNGIDPRDLEPVVGDLPLLRSRFARPADRLILLVGRLVYEKGFQIALEALPQVHRQLSDVRFVVAGSGTHEAQLRRQAEKLGLNDHGTFLGWIDDALLHSLYRIADLCVVPSIYEPFGLVALEAMATGCPCIVADTGGLREVVPGDETVGLRFRSDDAASLGDMVKKLLTDDSLRERLVAQASEHVLSFDWGDVARQTIKQYRQLLHAQV